MRAFAELQSYEMKSHKFMKYIVNHVLSSLTSFMFEATSKDIKDIEESH